MSNDRVALIQKKMSEVVAEFKITKNTRDEKVKEREAIVKEMTVVENSIIVIQKIANQAQINLKDKIVNIVQPAIDATMPGNYFHMDFVSKRNSTEVELSIRDKDGNEHDLINGNGGGLKDIISTALRIALWSIGKTSPVILLDEPFKFASEAYKEDSARLLSELSGELGIQFIIVSHVPQIIESGDTTYKVKLDKNKVSKVTKINS